MSIWPVIWNLVQSPTAAAPQSDPPHLTDDDRSVKVEQWQSSRWSLPVVYLQGSPYAMGWQHGYHLKQPIRSLVNQFYTRFAAGRLDRWFYRYFVPGRLFHLLEAVPAPYREELQGVADGAEVPLKDILLINFFDDLLNLLELGWATACTTVAVRGNEGRVIMGRNLDYTGPVGDLVRQFQAILYRHPDDGHPTLSITVVGQVGILTGSNGPGVCLGSLTAQSHERDWGGVGVSFIYRQMLDECASVDGALAQFDQVVPAQGNSLMVADANSAASLQFTSRRCRVTHLEHEPLAIANHYLDADLAATHTQLYEKYVKPGSHSRYQRLCDWRRQGLTPETAIQAMTDCQLPANDARSPQEFWYTPFAVSNQGTLHTAIFDPHHQRLALAVGPGDRPITPEDFVQVSSFSNMSASGDPTSKVSSPPTS